MESMDSMSHLFFNQIEQIADVKTCNIDNVEQKYYKVQWKCTWEPATVLERFCGKIINDYNKHTKHQTETVEKRRLVNIIEKSAVNVNCETANYIEDSQITSNLFNKEPTEIYTTNTDVLNKHLPDDNYTSANNLLQDKTDSVNNTTLNNVSITPDANQEVFPNINILCESNHTTFNQEEESSEDQNNGLILTLESADIPAAASNSNNTTTASNRRCNSTNQTQKIFKCHLCLFSSPLKSKLERHMQKHPGEKPLKCQLCKYSTSQKSHMKIHLLVHTSEKPFKCSICSYSTARKDSLKTHMPMHTGDYPYKCHLCSYSTIKNAVLKRHHTAKHKGLAFKDRQSLILK